MASSAEHNSLELLDSKHKETLRVALGNILGTKTAEFTYAQLFDGLPTVASLRETFVYMEGHPVFQLEHNEICEGFIEKTRTYRSMFDLNDLNFSPSLLIAFQNTIPDTREFHLRLIELVVVSCHQIGAYIYKLDDGAHKHQLFQQWLENELPKSRRGEHRNGYLLPPSAFHHMDYRDYEQYPSGLADVAGYWAEGMIFGGVVVFDRGESETECKSMWIHGIHIDAPLTLYPPTPEQFNNLVHFLITGPDNVAQCPLPIHATSLNRPRWDAYDALSIYHIFRDKYERKLPLERPQRGCVQKPHDWPEYADDSVILLQRLREHQGLEVDEQELAAAKERLKIMTPSSPLWHKR